MPQGNQPSARYQKADVGVGKQGRYNGGLIATPVAVYFRSRDRITFLNLQHALDLYKAQNGPPKSHEEFMEKVVKENQIQLPALPEGERYLYDPQKEELQVVKPAN